MRIGATADLQLDAGPSLADDRLADQEAVLNHAADLFHERGVDVALVVGDCFEKRHPSEEARLVFKRWLARLEPIRTIIVAGNHDLSNTALASAVDLYDRCEFIRSPRVLDLGGCSLACLPWAPIHSLVAGRESTERVGANQQAAEALVAIARDLRAQCPVGQPALLAAHWAISGASLPAGLPVDDLGEVVLPQEPLAIFDAVIAGHIHKGGEFAPRMAYCGSPYPCSFGEAEGFHGCVIIDTDFEVAEFVEIPSRRLVTIDCDLTEPLPLRATEKRLRGSLEAYVEYEFEHPDTLEDLYLEALGSAETEAQLGGEMATPPRARADSALQDSSVKGAASHAQEEGPRSPTPETVRPTLEAPGMRAPNPESNRERTGEGAEHGRAAFGANIEPDALLARGIKEAGDLTLNSQTLAEGVSERERRPLQGAAGETPPEMATDTSQGREATLEEGLKNEAPTRAYSNSRSLTVLDETSRIAATISTHDLTDATVRLRYTATEEQHRRVDIPAIRRVLADAGAHRLFSVEPTILRADRERVKGLDETAEPTAALDAWCEANGVDAGKREGLQALLEKWSA